MQDLSVKHCANAPCITDGASDDLLGVAAYGNCGSLGHDEAYPVSRSCQQTLTALMEWGQEPSDH